MEFKVIPDEQTPKVSEVAFSDSKLYIGKHTPMLLDFLNFAKSQPNAVGLAANQCNVFAGDEDDEDGIRFMMRVFAIRNMVTREWSLIIDPHINRYFGIKETKGEGCLTWKHMVIVAERHRQIEVDYFDFDGVFHEGEIIKGFPAQIWQHEVNHLNGIEEDVRIDFKEEPVIEVGRNEPCPCGSGKKYKKCCLI